MRFQIATGPEHTYTVHFDRELPLLLPTRNPPWRTPSPLLASPNARLHLARRLAALNRVHRPFELLRPTSKFAAVLGDLALIDGLVEILNVDRYSATLQIGALFPPLEVATRYAECMRDHFYAGEPLEFIPIDDSPRCDDRLVGR
jgi:hypothetical protein